ncbi:MAG: hypothetical protein P8164_12830 [Gammaproteobacteria bacterium]
MKATQSVIPYLILAIAMFSLTEPLMAAPSAGIITILSPQNGADLSSGTGDKLRYNVQLSPTGNHLHVYVDHRRPIIDHNVNNCPCSITLPDMSPGKHTIAVKEATVNHHLTGLQATVSFKVE